MNIRIHFDGACHNIPGENNDMGIGIAVFINDEYQEDQSLAQFVKYETPLGTSNVAEWTGCVEAMKMAVGMRRVYPQADIKIFSDSQLISYQFNGKYAIKEPSFVPFMEEAKKHAHKAQIREIQWIKREYNTQADELSKIGLKEMAPKKYWYLHDESDSCFIATEAECEELQKHTPSDLWQLREVQPGETDKDADSAWEEHQRTRQLRQHPEVKNFQKLLNQDNT